MIKRAIEDKIRADFGKGKAIVILGPRQVGKTTLLNQLADGFGKKIFLNCDNADDRADLEKESVSALKSIVGNAELLLIDEAQRVRNIGLVIKMLVDAVGAKTQIVVTGSSSLELANGIYESAAGRTFEYRLLPFSAGELGEATSEREERRMLETRLVYGGYPEAVLDGGDAERILESIVNGALHKDLLAFGGIRKPEVLSRLVQCLALQVGSEVSYNELSGMVGVDKLTVENYIDLLEKTFVVFRLPSFSRNARNEIRKGRKIYFYDNGIRNAVLGNFSSLQVRADVGELWENYLMAERVKRNAYRLISARGYFWRTTLKSEIDYIEEVDGKIAAFEFKWNDKRRLRCPQPFAAAYPGAAFNVVTPANREMFLG